MRKIRPIKIFLLRGRKKRKIHVYEYVPNFFVGDKKVYEAHPGESYGETKFYIKKVFDDLLK